MNKIVQVQNEIELGVATASYQIEGGFDEDGKGENIWDRFTRVPGKIVDGTNGNQACDFYHLYKNDIEIMSDLGLQVFRFSINWARILPDGTGTVSKKGIEFYRNVLEELKEKGIKSCVTIYHWDLPQKLQDKGGWLNRESVQWYTEYSKILFKEYGELVDSWITLNEPWCIAVLGHWTGEHAPGHHDYSEMLLCAHNLMMAHGSAVKEFRKLNLKSEIGVTLNMNMIYPSNPDDPGDVEAAKRAMQVQNNLFGDPIWKGTYPEELLVYLKNQGVSIPEVHDEDMELIHQPLDFFGLNSYYAEKVAENENWPLNTKMEKFGKSHTDADWEICPDELYELLVWIKNTYNPEKLIITENGSAWNDIVCADGKVHDANRIDYLGKYLEQVSKAVDAGVPVRGYYVWCFTDNFEWAHGLSRRFGIVYVDYGTQKRIVKDSANWFANVIKERKFEIG